LGIVLEPRASGGVRIVTKTGSEAGAFLHDNIESQLLETTDAIRRDRHALLARGSLGWNADLHTESWAFPVISG
jgi:hypothetical protein